MAIVQSFGSLHALTPTPSRGITSSSVALYGQRLTFPMLYERQPNIRVCVDFLARNIAHLGFPGFRRVSDTDRERLHGHDLGRWLARPNPSTTQYRLFESLVADIGVYFDAYWLKVRYRDAIDGRRAIGLVRLPPDEMTVKGRLLPTGYCWTVNGREIELPLSEVVHFDGYNPRNAVQGLSPLVTLRRILAEEAAAGEHRENYWRNASRQEGVIERPLGAPRWTGDQKTSWREQWQARFSGGAGAGQVAVLEDGMTWKATSFSMRDSEYLASRKLSAEECARMYHIPLPMVGILEHATFSNIREQHKHLYQDCLGPMLKMITQEIHAQLLIECEDQRDVYYEFNIAEKLSGSFEEQSAALQALVGRPIMTANEGRARLNLPAVTDDPSADRLAEQQGGPAFVGGGRLRPGADDPGGGSALAVSQVVRATWARQASRLSRVPVEERADALDRARATRELAADLHPYLDEFTAYWFAARITDNTATLLSEGADAFTADRKVLP